MKKCLFMLLALLAAQAAASQTLEKMQWFNEPEEWSIKGDVLTFRVTPHTDYWRISHYGFTVDDAPFYYATYGGEFEAKNYIKAGIEFVDGKYNLSAVVTHTTSDWSVIELERPVPFIWLKAVRRLDAVEIFYSFDDRTYTLMRNAPLQDNTPVMVGPMAASPDGEGFRVRFEQFKVTHLPDLRRTEWLKRNAAE